MEWDRNKEFDDRDKGSGEEKGQEQAKKPVKEYHFMPKHFRKCYKTIALIELAKLNLMKEMETYKDKTSLPVALLTIMDTMMSQLNLAFQQTNEMNEVATLERNRVRILKEEGWFSESRKELDRELSEVKEDYDKKAILTLDSLKDAKSLIPFAKALTIYLQNIPHPNDNNPPPQIDAFIKALDNFLGKGTLLGAVGHIQQSLESKLMLVKTLQENINGIKIESELEKDPVVKSQLQAKYAKALAEAKPVFEKYDKEIAHLEELFDKHAPGAREGLLKEIQNKDSELSIACANLIKWQEQQPTHRPHQ